MNRLSLCHWKRLLGNTGRDPSTVTKKERRRLLLILILILQRTSKKEDIRRKGRIGRIGRIVRDTTIVDRT